MLQEALWPNFIVSDRKTSDRPKSLFVHGLKVDTIAKLGPVLKTASICKNGLSLISAVLPVKQCLKAFGPWSQIVGHGSPAYSKALLYCLRVSPTGNINTNTNRLIAGSEVELSLVINFVQQVQRVN
jgi:hypothetical protein